MNTLPDLEAVRVLSAPVEFRAATDDESLGTMTGHFSVFNRWYEIDSIFEGLFLERVAPGAFKKTISDQADGAEMKVLYEHGRDFSVGNKPLGVPETVREDKTGAYYEVPLLDTTYNRDLLPGLRVGAFGASFRFASIKDEWDDEPGVSDHNPKGIPERTLKEVRVPEFGPCTFGANPGATAGVRSVTDEFYDHLRSLNPERYDDLLSRAQQLRTPAQPGAEGAPAGGGAAARTEEPREHSTAIPAPEARHRDLIRKGVLK
jgi:HK97 family phage prohead protease